MRNFKKNLADIAPQQDNWSLELKEEEINYDVFYLYFYFVFNFIIKIVILIKINIIMKTLILLNK